MRRVSCARPRRALQAVRISSAVDSRSIDPETRLRYSPGSVCVDSSPSQARRSRPISNSLRAIAAQPNGRRCRCSSETRGPVLALMPTPAVACCSGDSRTRTVTGVAAAFAGSESISTLTPSNSPAVCRRSWKSSSRVSVAIAPGSNAARSRTLRSSWCRKPSMRNSPMRNSGPLSAIASKRARRSAASIWRARAAPGRRRVAGGAQARDQRVLRVAPGLLAERRTRLERPVVAQPLQRALGARVAGLDGGLQIALRFDRDAVDQRARAGVDAHDRACVRPGARPARRPMK